MNFCRKLTTWRVVNCNDPTILILHYLKAQRSTFPAMQTLQLGSHADEVERVTNAVMRRLMDGNHNMGFSFFNPPKEPSPEYYEKSVGRLNEIYVVMWENARKSNDRIAILSIPKDPLFLPTGINTEDGGSVQNTFSQVMSLWRREIEKREELLFQNATDEQKKKYFGAEAEGGSDEASIANYRDMFIKRKITLPSREFAKGYGG